MYKRVWSVAAVLVTVLAISAWVLSAQAGESTDLVIPIGATDSARERTSAKAGDACHIYSRDPEAKTAKQQIVVRDEHDTIIAVQNLEGLLTEGSSGSSLRCNVDLEVPVPDSEFFTVYVGDRRIQAYSSDEFPIDVWDAIILHFD